MRTWARIAVGVAIVLLLGAVALGAGGCVPRNAVRTIPTVVTDKATSIVSPASADAATFTPSPIVVAAQSAASTKPKVKPTGHASTKPEKKSGSSASSGKGSSHSKPSHTQSSHKSTTSATTPSGGDREVVTPKVREESGGEGGGHSQLTVGVISTSASVSPAHSSAGSWGCASGDSRRSPGTFDSRQGSRDSAKADRSAR